MIREATFGRSGGFGDSRRSDEYYYSQGMQKTRFGLSTGYGITAVKSSDDISGLGQVKYMAEKDGRKYGQDSNGKVYRETTAGAMDFGNAHHTPSVSSSGRGLITDQKNRLLVFADTTITKYDSAYVEGWQTGLTSAEHAPDLFEDMVLFANGNKVGAIYSDDSMALDAFELPTGFTVVIPKAGKNGVLVGANLGSTGYLMLWDPNFADRSRAPWLKTSGTVQAIETVDTGWIVTTSKGVFLTNGYSIQTISTIFDDALGYNAFTVYPQGTLCINEKLFILNAATGYQRLKPGVYILDLVTRLFEFVPISTLNTNAATPRVIFASKSTTQTIVVTYNDGSNTKNYFGSFAVTAGNRAFVISEPVGNGVDDKASEAVVLHIAPSTIIRGKGAFSFDVSVKIADMRRPLWGIHVTNALASAADQIRVDGTNTSFFKAEAGDEVTVLDGPNAGQIRHISSIANAGASNETWTLDEALSGATASGVTLQVEPYKLLAKKQFTNETRIPKETIFPDTEKHVGKQFLVKTLFENITNVQLELHPSTFAYDDLQTTP